jgi:hypothetical protein
VVGAERRHLQAEGHLDDVGQVAVAIGRVDGLEGRVACRSPHEQLHGGAWAAGGHALVDERAQTGRDGLGLEVTASMSIAGGGACGWRSLAGSDKDFVEDGRGGWHALDLGAEPVCRLPERGLVEQSAKRLGHRIGGDLVRLESQCGAGGQ